VYCTQILCTVHNILYSTHQCVLVVYNSFCVLSTHSCTQQYTNLCTVHNFCVLYTQFLGQYTTSSVLQYTKLVCSTEVPGGNPSRPHRLAPIPSNHRDPNQKDFTWLVAFSYNNLRAQRLIVDTAHPIQKPKSERLEIFHMVGCIQLQLKQASKSRQIVDTAQAPRGSK